MGRRQDLVIYTRYVGGWSLGALAEAYPRYSVNRLRTILARAAAPVFDEARAEWRLRAAAGAAAPVVRVDGTGQLWCERCCAGTCGHIALVVAGDPAWQARAAAVQSRRVRRDGRAHLVRGALAAYWAALRAQYVPGGEGGLAVTIAHPKSLTPATFTFRGSLPGEPRPVWGAECQAAFRRWYAELWHVAVAAWEAFYGEYELADDPPVQRATGLDPAVSPLEISIPLLGGGDLQQVLREGTP